MIGATSLFKLNEILKKVHGYTRPLSLLNASRSDAFSTSSHLTLQLASILLPHATPPPPLLLHALIYSFSPLVVAPFYLPHPPAPLNLASVAVNAKCMCKWSFTTDMLPDGSPLAVRRN